MGAGDVGRGAAGPGLGVEGGSGSGGLEEVGRGPGSRGLGFPSRR